LGVWGLFLNMSGGVVAQENVVVVRFAEPSRAYQALSVLKECQADGRIGVDSAAVVERTFEGGLVVQEGADNVGLIGTASGSLIGMLVGVLGGPVGVLVGWGAGALTGSLFDVDLDRPGEPGDSGCWDSDLDEGGSVSVVELFDGDGGVVVD